VKDLRDAEAAEAVARLEGVSKRWGRRAGLEDVSLTLAPGETVALIGHNGAGKTTLMKLMLGLSRPSGGRVEVLGRDPASGRAASGRGVGYLPENVAFSPALTGRELLRFYGRLKGVGRRAREALLEEVGLAEAADRRVGTWSKGMRQRLGLAQALLGEPRLLLLDEPTTGLDPSLRLAFYDILAQLRAKGVTVVLSSHALTELEDRADRVAILDGGRLIADGTLETLRRLADLPARIRVTLSAPLPPERLSALAGIAEVRETPDGLALTCGAAAKMETLRRAVTLGPEVTDVGVTPPTLDELYAHVRRREAAP
jgi:Cu-processing system ATP-binding protein